MFAIPIITELFGLGKTYLEGKIQLRKATTEAQSRIIEKSAQHEGEYENIMATASQTSWKDEYWTIILSIPMIMCFIPGMQESVERGFDALNKTPEWYRYLMFTAVLAAFGLRGLSKWVNK